ncbi:MAG: hypothetical protein HZC47_07840 [Methanobacterium sp.]|uniref:hypothetical protein n=1 Tax=Methanobacterium sp. TaxID=2164 RepID=UPI003D6536BD|nr:hypothetical protein [Methanobacterium sp.]
MNKIKSTIGFVGTDSVILKDHNAFEKGDLVLVISADNFDELLSGMMEIKDNINISKSWIDEIKEIKANNFKKKS